MLINTILWFAFFFFVLLPYAIINEIILKLFGHPLSRPLDALQSSSTGRLVVVK
jgi:hypothetical protein